MSKQPEQTERKRREVVKTLFDPKAFPTIIPVLLAIVSAFITLDRMVHKVTITQELHTETLSKHEARLDNLQRTYVDVLVLKTRLERAVIDADGQERLQAELNDLVHEMKQAVDADKVQMTDIRRRLRNLERQVDKIVK